MARAKLSDETIENVMAAVLAEAKANDKLPELLAATLKKLREKNPQAADAVLRMMIETIAASMHEDKRQTFLNELMAFVRLN